MSMLWSPIYQLFRDALRDVREHSNLTQVQLSSLLGKPQSYVSKIESGERKLDILEVRSYCHACGINWLVFLRSLEQEFADLESLSIKKRK